MKQRIEYQGSLCIAVANLDQSIVKVEGWTLLHAGENDGMQTHRQSKCTVEWLLKHVRGPSPIKRAGRNPVEANGVFSMVTLSGAEELNAGTIKHDAGLCTPINGSMSVIVGVVPNTCRVHISPYPRVCYPGRGIWHYGARQQCSGSPFNTIWRHEVKLHTGQAGDRHGSIRRITLTPRGRE
jgi:hypothetical protein